MLVNSKREITNLLRVAQQIDRITPLIYEGEHVVEHLQRIEEFFDELEENLSEVRDYMIALLEYVVENEDDMKQQMIPYLEKIIEMLKYVIPEQDPNAYDNSTPGYQEITPDQLQYPTGSLNDAAQSPDSPIILASPKAAPMISPQ